MTRHALIIVWVFGTIGCSEDLASTSQFVPDAGLKADDPLSGGNNDPGTAPSEDAAADAPDVSDGANGDAGAIGDGSVVTDGAAGSDAQPDGPVSSPTTDPFGVQKVYPTVEGGEEFFLNMSDPLSDPRFDPQQSLEPVDSSGNKVAAGSSLVDAFRVGKKDRQVRLTVFHSPNSRNAYQWPGPIGANWRNVEVTGYFYVESLDTSSSPSNGWLKLVSRTGRHAEISHDRTSSCPQGRESLRCEGSAYQAGLRSDGWVAFEKEFWHSVYADPIDLQQPENAHPLQGQWVGLKVVMYNVPDKAAGQTNVVLEEWVDWDASKTSWHKVSSRTDKPGQIHANVSDTVFICPQCKRHDANDALTAELLRPDDVISWGGPKTGFWSDGMVVRVKSLSVREIEPIAP